MLKNAAMIAMIIIENLYPESAFSKIQNGVEEKLLAQVIRLVSHLKADVEPKSFSKATLRSTINFDEEALIKARVVPSSRKEDYSYIDQRFLPSTSNVGE